MHLSKNVDGYSLDVLDKTGVSMVSRPVNIELKHRDFTRHVHASLQTDTDGRIRLGELENIESIMARLPDGTTRTWPLGGDLHSRPDTIHTRAGDALSLPYMGEATSPERGESHSCSFGLDCTHMISLTPFEWNPDLLPCTVLPPATTAS